MKFQTLFNRCSKVHSSYSNPYPNYCAKYYTNQFFFVWFFFAILFFSWFFIIIFGAGTRCLWCGSSTGSVEGSKCAVEIKSWILIFLAILNGTLIFQYVPWFWTGQLIENLFSGMWSMVIDNFNGNVNL